MKNKDEKPFPRSSAEHIDRIGSRTRFLHVVQGSMEAAMMGHCTIDDMKIGFAAIFLRRMATRPMSEATRASASLCARHAPTVVGDGKKKGHSSWNLTDFPVLSGLFACSYVP